MVGPKLRGLNLKLLITQRRTDYAQFRQEVFLVEAESDPLYGLPCKERLEVRVSDYDLMITRNVADLVCRTAIKDLPEDFFPSWSPV
jgi:hypothetical protein